jgi:hypothetical protein
MRDEDRMPSSIGDAPAASASCVIVNLRAVGVATPGAPPVHASTVKSPVLEVASHSPPEKPRHPTRRT